MKTLLFLLAAGSLLMGEKLIVVDLSEQMAYAKENGKTVFKGMISSGKPGHETPTGTFVVSQKEREHKSTIYPKPYGGAAMDFMLRLSGSEIAMHLGNTPGYPASHGCIRCTYKLSKRLYPWAEIGTKIIVKGSAESFKGRTAKQSTHTIIVNEKLYPGDVALNRLNVSNDEIY